MAFDADNASSSALLIDVDLATGVQTVVGQLWDGTLTLDEASAVVGAPLSGHVEGTLYASPSAVP